MSQIYYCDYCNQKYMEHEELNSKRIYSSRIPDGDKRKVKEKPCRICSKLFNNNYTYSQYYICRIEPEKKGNRP